MLFTTICYSFLIKAFVFAKELTSELFVHVKFSGVVLIVLSVFKRYCS